MIVVVVQLPVAKRSREAAINHFLVRNLLAAEPSLNPQFDALFDAATPEEQRDTLPPLPAILVYREAIARRTHAHIEAVLAGTRPARPAGDVRPRCAPGGSRPASSPGCSAGLSAPQGHQSFCTPPRKGGRHAP